MKKIKSNLETFLRRALDIIVGSIGILFFFPLFIIVSIAIKRDTPGPIFYRGKRVGKDGETFDILKFRTMFDTEESFMGPRLTAHDDPRVTSVGARLRDTKINELPQLWNVVKGDMSLVGPRPEDPTLAAEWPAEVRETLLSVKPGITSPASVIYRNLDLMLHSDRVVDEYLQTILPSKMRFDTLYVRNRTILMDLDILFWTVVGLLPPMRKTHVAETKLFWGPLSSFMTNDLRWILVDFLVALVSVAIVGAVWRSIAPLRIGWLWAPLIALEMALIFGLSNALLGLNKIFWSRARPSDAVELAFSTSLSVLILLVIDFVAFWQPDVPVALYLFGGAISYLGFIVVRYRERLLTGAATRWIWLRSSASGIGEHVLMIGGGELGEFAIWLVRKGGLPRAFRVVGIVDDDPKKQGMRIDGVRVIGTSQEIEELVRTNDIGVVFFAIANIESAERERILRALKKMQVKVVLIPNIIDLMRSYFGASMDGDGPSPSVDTLPGQVDLDAELMEIEALLANGEIEGALEQIQAIRSRAQLADSSTETYEHVLEK